MKCDCPAKSILHSDHMEYANTECKSHIKFGDKGYKVKCAAGYKSSNEDMYVVCMANGRSKVKGALDGEVKCDSNYYRIEIMK